MVTTSLLKRIEGLELWAIVAGSAEQFAVRTGERKVRVVQSIEAAETFLAAKLQNARIARSH
jgi:hypothetical protein